MSGLRALEKLVVSFEVFPIFAQALMQYFPFTALQLVQKVAGNSSLEKFNLEYCRMNIESSQFAVEASETVATPQYIAQLCNFTLNVLQLLPEISLKAFKSFNMYQSLLKLIDDSIISAVLQRYEKTTDLSQKFRLRILFKDLATVYKSVVQLLTFLHVNASKHVPIASLFITTLTRLLCLKLPKTDNSSTEISSNNRIIPDDLKHELFALLALISRSLKALLQKNASNVSLLSDCISVVRSQNKDFCNLILTMMENLAGNQQFLSEILNLLTYVLSSSFQIYRVILRIK